MESGADHLQSASINLLPVDRLQSEYVFSFEGFFNLAPEFRSQLRALHSFPPDLSRRPLGATNRAAIH